MVIFTSFAAFSKGNSVIRSIDEHVESVLETFFFIFIVILVDSCLFLLLTQCNKTCFQTFLLKYLKVFVLAVGNKIKYRFSRFLIAMHHFLERNNKLNKLNILHSGVRYQNAIPTELKQTHTEKNVHICSYRVHFIALFYTRCKNNCKKNFI